MNTIKNKTAKEIAAIMGCTPAQAAAGLLRNATSMRLYSDADLKRIGKTRAQVNAMADNYESRANYQLAELKQMIAGTVAAYPDRRQCWKAMSAIQWRLRGPLAEFVGLNKNLACAFVPESESIVFDGRDNEDMKLAAYQSKLGRLLVEIIPQNVNG